MEYATLLLLCYFAMAGSTEDVVNGHTHSVRRRNLIFPSGGIILVIKHSLEILDVYF
jgi:hypothetical protein